MTAYGDDPLPLPLRTTIGYCLSYHILRYTRTYSAPLALDAPAPGARGDVGRGAREFESERAVELPEREVHVQPEPVLPGVVPQPQRAGASAKKSNKLTTISNMETYE